MPVCYKIKTPYTFSYENLIEITIHYIKNKVKSFVNYFHLDRIQM